MDFYTYIHSVGIGKKINRDLTYEESKDMMHQILDKQAHPEQISAFLLGWRLKPESTTEFKGAIDACSTYIKSTSIKNSIELGYPFDGKVKNPYLFPLIAKILEQSDLNLVLVGDNVTSVKDGTTVKDICTQTDTNKNLHYFDRKDFFKQMHELTPTRMRLGLRTGLNTLEKLTGVASSEFGVTGVFHKPYVQKYVEIFGDKYKRLAIIKGNEGTPELFSKSRMWLAEDSNIQEIIIDPAYYGINYKRSQERISKEESFSLLQNPSDELLKLAKLNAAILLFTANKADNISDAYEILNG